MNKTIGIVLVVVGVLGLAYGGLTYKTTETIVDLGPIKATQEKTHELPITPIASGLVLAAGVVLIVTAKK